LVGIVILVVLAAKGKDAWMTKAGQASIDADSIPELGPGDVPT
jgi:hypothetical protein